MDEADTVWMNEAVKSIIHPVSASINNNGLSVGCKILVSQKYFPNECLLLISLGHSFVCQEIFLAIKIPKTSHDSYIDRRLSLEVFLWEFLLRESYRPEAETFLSTQPQAVPVIL